MNHKLMFGLFLSLFSVTSIFAQQEKVDWSYKAKRINAQEVEVTFTAKVANGWYIYSQFLGDEGPIPTTFEFDSGETIGKASEKGYKKEGYDAVFDMNLVKFGKTVTFTHRLKLSGSTKTLSGILTYMTCNDEQCLPPTDVEFSIAL